MTFDYRRWSRKNRTGKNKRSQLHREKERQRAKDWRIQNRVAYRAMRRKMYARNRVKYAQQRARSYKRCSSHLSDGLVRKRLIIRTKLKAAQVPQPLVDAKRAHIRLIRTIKEAARQSTGK